MKKITLILVVVGLVIVMAIFLIQKYVAESFDKRFVSDTPRQDLRLDESREEYEIKAAFVIFTNGTKRDFSALMYHNLSPDAYITAANPNIVTVTKKGIMWQQFFDTLPFKLTKECLTTGTKQTFCTGQAGVLKFYLNGALNNNILFTEINQGDKALITYGAEEEPNLDYQLSQIPNPQD